MCRLDTSWLYNVIKCVVYTRGSYIRSARYTNGMRLLIIFLVFFEITSIAYFIQEDICPKQILLNNPGLSPTEHVISYIYIYLREYCHPVFHKLHFICIILPSVLLVSSCYNLCATWVKIGLCLRCRWESYLPPNVDEFNISVLYPPPPPSPQS